MGGSTYMLKDAGDGYELLKGKGRDTGVVDLDILEKYIVEKLGGRISAAQYGDSQDRLIKR